MKRLFGDKLYIQVSDIIFLLSGDYEVPNALKDYLYDNYKTISSSKSGNEFICFSNPDDIKYLNGVSFITDYDIYMKVSIDILESIIEKMTCSKRQMELKINNIRKPSEELKENYKIINLKISDISNIYLYRMNEIKLNIPGEKYEHLLIKEFKRNIEKIKPNENNNK